MLREVSIEDIWDGRFYSRNDAVHIGCHDCEGCSACCRNTGDSIILDPLDMYCLTIWTHKQFKDMIEKEIEIREVDGMILPNIMEHDEAHPEKPDGCPFLNSDGRCGIYQFRPGFCRLFPLGRYYVDPTAGAAAPPEPSVPSSASSDGSASSPSSVPLSGEDEKHRGFYYFVQDGECALPDDGKYDVKVSDWLGVENAEQYEKFIVTWHFFLKDTSARLKRYPKPAREPIARSILQIFFVQPYDRFHDFYPQFEERLASVRRQLSRL